MEESNKTITLFIAHTVARTQSSLVANRSLLSKYSSDCISSSIGF